MSFEKLKVAIKEDTGIDLINFARTYAGTHQRGGGAWSWTAQTSERSDYCGSTSSANLRLHSRPIVLLENTSSHAYFIFA